jgi:hypothetical protein
VREIQAGLEYILAGINHIPKHRADNSFQQFSPAIRGGEMIFKVDCVMTREDRIAKGLQFFSDPFPESRA